jgi:hypothetical protein
MYSFVLLLAFGLGLGLGCVHQPPDSVASVAQNAPAVTPVDPVRFASGSSRLAGPEDQARVEEAAAQLKSNPRLYVVLVGYSDAGGRPESNLALSQSRADFVADLLKGAGCDDRRLFARGLGTAPGSNNNKPEDRRVEFVFYSSAPGELPTADAILASRDAPPAAAPADPPPSPAPAARSAKTSARSGDDDGFRSARTRSGDDDGFKTTKSSSATSSTREASTAGEEKTSKKEDKSSGKARTEKKVKERKDMEVCGLKDLDAFFAKGQALLTKLRTNQDRIATARASLGTLMGLGADADMATALGELKALAVGSFSIKMEGIKPRVAVKPTAPPKAAQGVQAVNGLVDAMGRATLDLATLPKDAMALVNEAKALPAKVPNMAKDAGLKPLEIPGVLKIVKNDIALLTTLPGEAQDLLAECKDTFDLIKQTFAGG